MVVSRLFKGGAMHLLFVAAEALPWASTGGLGEAIAGLAAALARLGHRVTLVLPRYRWITPEPVTLAALETIPMGERSIACTLLRGAASEEAAGVETWFVDCPPLFDRSGLYGENGHDYPDNPERFALLARAGLRLAQRLQPDLIHAHEWHTALVPVLLRTEFRDDACLGSLPVVFTIHNLAFQGIFPPEVASRIGLDPEWMQPDRMEFWGRVNFLKGALTAADAITTVSPGYSREIQTPEFGMGLDGLLRRRSDALTGILNGIDTAQWDPSTDAHLVETFDATHLEGKAACTEALRREFGLAPLDRPVLALLSRLSPQKGIDLIEATLDRMIALELDLIVLGQGDAEHAARVRSWEHRFPQWIRAVLRYDEGLAHRLLAGADLLLMPSRYEPCGLSQMHAMRYGTVPVVHAVGGLRDTVTEWDGAEGSGTGFLFTLFHPDALLHSLVRAVAMWTRRSSPSSDWRRMQVNGMTADWSWQHAATEYARLYRQLAPAAPPLNTGMQNILRPAAGGSI
jgi:starch synthase